MKWIYFFLMLLSVLLGSCKDTTEVGPLSLCHYTYDLSFMDNKGNDVLDGIYTVANETHETILTISTYSYEPYMPVEIFYENRIPVLKRDNLYLRFYAMKRYDAETDIPTVLEFDFIHSYIFGDNEKHRIITYWEVEGKKEKRATLQRLTVDGIEGEILVNSQEPVIRKAIVRLNRNN